MRKHDLVWIIVDTLTKIAHFLSLNLRIYMLKLNQTHINEIVILYGVPSSIVSYCDPCFASRFWHTL